MNISSLRNLYNTGLITSGAPAPRSHPWTEPVPLEPQDSFIPSQPDDAGIYKPRLRVGDNGNQVKTGDVATQQSISEKELRKSYATEGPHSALIAKGKYAEAGLAYREEAAKLDKKDPRRAALETRAAQLEYAAKMQTRDRKVSFPPTLDEVKSHFQDLRQADPQEVAREFRGYVKAYYQHVQDLDPSADVVYDRDKDSKVRGESKPVATFTPEDFADVTDQRALNSKNQRLIDCEGYAFLGAELLGQAGFKQGKEGSYMLMLGNKQSDGSQKSHLMLFLKRDNGESLYVSNDHAFDSPQKALSDGWKALGLPAGQEMELYHGKNEREALAHAEAGNVAYRMKRNQAW